MDTVLITTVEFLEMGAAFSEFSSPEFEIRSLPFFKGSLSQYSNGWDRSILSLRHVILSGIFVVENAPNSSDE